MLTLIIFMGGFRVIFILGAFCKATRDDPNEDISQQEERVQVKYYLKMKSKK